MTGKRGTAHVCIQSVFSWFVHPQERLPTGIAIGNARFPMKLAKGDSGMWAQLITMRLKPGMDNELVKVTEMLKATEQPGSGLLRSTTMTDQNDPSRVYTLVVFESEEKARER
jgi:hypothetical protein